MKKIYKSFLFLLVLFCFDFFLKQYTYHHISMMSWKAPDYPFGGIGIFHFGPISFSLNFVQNRGAAWGLFSGYPHLLIFMRGIIILGLLGYLIKNFQKNLFFMWMIFVGAVGNLVDYFLYGHVIDMFHFCFWGYTPFVFNVADAMISLGMIGLLIKWYFLDTDHSLKDSKEMLS